MDARASDTFDWGYLVREIRRERVVPIIGPELLPYHRELAEPLAEVLNVPLAHAAGGVSSVADATVDRNRSRINSELQTLLEGYQEIVPTLEALVAIPEFQLFLTTDYASVIEQSLERRGEQHETLRFALKGQADDVSGYPRGRRCVYHVLGHLGRSGGAALKRVDQLEYLHELQTNGPRELIETLKERNNLLFLGCNLPEWLAGFFTRIVLGRPLHDLGRGLEVVASEATARGAAASSPLTTFLRENGVQFYPGNASDFVTQLARHYGPTKREPARLPPAGRGHAFVSYCRKDADDVRRLVHALRSRNVEVWFDETQLAPGAHFDEEIRIAIQEDASSFLPIISSAALQAYSSYFIEEWRCALKAQERRFQDNRFVFPIVIDGQDRAVVAEQLRRSGFAGIADAQFQVCPGGDGIESWLVQELLAARKRYERSRR